MLQEAQLRDALNDNQLVRSDGSYILCFWLTAPGDSAGLRTVHRARPELAEPLFGGLPALR